jgi:hypothetical protein
VSKTSFKADGTETIESDPDVDTVKYTIVTPMALSSATVETIMFVPLTTGARAEIAYPDALQLSSPPLSGTFYASCYNTDGNKYDTQDMDIADIDAKKFKQVLERDCSFLKGKISVE